MNINRSLHGIAVTALVICAMYGCSNTRISTESSGDSVKLSIPGNGAYSYKISEGVENQTGEIKTERGNTETEHVTSIMSEDGKFITITPRGRLPTSVVVNVEYSIDELFSLGPVGHRASLIIHLNNNDAKSR